MWHSSSEWLLFTLFILAFTLLDLKGHRKSVSIKKALCWSGFWFALALFFNFYIYVKAGKEQALSFFSVFLLEKSLSIDNLFVFHAIFQSLNIQPLYQSRCLLWGVIGALAMRAFFIIAGVALIEQFNWITYLLALFLGYTAYQMAKSHGKATDFKQHPLYHWCQKYLPFTPEMGDGRFFLKENGKWKITTLFLTLVLIEITDLIFALDSIPAALAITTDPFIIYTANAFALMGLRSLYFVLRHAISSFYYLHHTLAFILAFIAVKMFLAHLYPIPITVTLTVLGTSLTVGIIASLRHKHS